MEQKQLLTLVGVGLAGYLAYSYFLAPAPAAAATSGAGSGGTTTPPSGGGGTGTTPPPGSTGTTTTTTASGAGAKSTATPAVPAGTPAITPPTADQLVSKLKTVAPYNASTTWDGKATADQWSWAWLQISGQHTTQDLFTAGNRSELIDVSTYMSRRKSAGLGYMQHSLNKAMLARVLQNNYQLPPTVTMKFDDWAAVCTQANRYVDCFFYSDLNPKPFHPEQPLTIDAYWAIVQPGFQSRGINTADYDGRARWWA